MISHFLEVVSNNLFPWTQFEDDQRDFLQQWSRERLKGDLSKRMYLTQHLNDFQEWM